MLGKKKIEKTNGIRILEQLKIDFHILTYEITNLEVDGITVAKKLGHPVSHVYKTLVTTTPANFYVFVIPVQSELDLKEAAKQIGVKKLELLPMKQLLPTTGYVRGGCSPIGMKKQYATFIDKSAKNIDYIIVSAGKIGMQIQLNPKDLQKITKAQFVQVIK